MYLNDPKQMKDIIGVIALLDLHGPTFYPTDKKSADARLVWAKKYLEDQVPHNRFHQFFAVHEVEAWLLSDPDLLPPQVKRALPPKAKHPEKVNFDEPPKKLLQRPYRKRPAAFTRTWCTARNSSQRDRRSLRTRSVRSSRPCLTRCLNWPGRWGCDRRDYQRYLSGGSEPYLSVSR